VTETGRPDTMAVQKYDIRRPDELGGGFEERHWSPLNAPVFDANQALAFIVHRVEDVTDYVRLSQESAETRARTDALEARAHRSEREVLERSRELSAANSSLAEALRALRRDKDQIEALMRAIGDAVVMTDGEGRIDYINSAAERLTGWRRGDLLGRGPEQTLLRDDGAALGWSELREIAVGDEPSVEDYRLVRRDGYTLTVAASISSVRTHDDRIAGLTIVIRDVTEEREQTQVLWFQARHDALTGLVNRREFLHRLEHSLGGARRGAQHVLCMIDLDGFKQINDEGGHDAGDELLRRVARRMERSLRQRDTLARMGGDEFACLLEHCSLEQGERLAGELRGAIQSTTVRRHGRIFQVDASIGLAEVSASSGEPEEILRVADAACYAAKRSERKIQVRRERGIERPEPRT
jgi:diguanylate cyclase (GGDEF)-like protein/PAS domain S-box-containing protein